MLRKEGCFKSCFKIAMGAIPFGYLRWVPLTYSVDMKCPRISYAEHHGNCVIILTFDTFSLTTRFLGVGEVFVVASIFRWCMVVVVGAIIFKRRERERDGGRNREEEREGGKLWFCLLDFIDRPTTETSHREVKTRETT